MSDAVQIMAAIGAMATFAVLVISVSEAFEARRRAGIRIANGLGEYTPIEEWHGRYYTIEGDAIRWLSPPKVTP